MKISPLILVILLILSFTVGAVVMRFSYTSPPPPQTELETPAYEVARLNEYEEHKIEAYYGGLSLDLIIRDASDDSVVATLHVENPRHGPPTYEIVRGDTHDWLVVTRFERSGTGFKENIEDWYVLGISGFEQVQPQ